MDKRRKQEEENRTDRDEKAILILSSSSSDAEQETDEEDDEPSTPAQCSNTSKTVFIEVPLVCLVSKGKLVCLTQTMLPTNLTFLLVGKTGCGKSAVGNTILGQNVFISSDSFESGTQEIQIESASRLGFHLTVVDSPGVMHTGLNLNESKYKTCRDLQKAVYQIPDSSDLMAIVLVLRYEDRFTEENKTVFAILKQMFGQENLLRSCVIVMSYGDLFHINNPQTISFDDWLKQQRGEMEELLRHMNFRCILFNNRASTLLEQDNKLLTLIQSVRNLDQGYTKANFYEVKKQHARLIIETQLKDIKLHYLHKHSDFKSRFRDSFSPKNMNEFKILTKKIKMCLLEMDEKDDPTVISYDQGERRLLDVERQMMENLMAHIKREKTILIMDATIANFINALTACDESEFHQIHMHEETYTNLLSAVEGDQDFDNLKNQLSIANTILTRIKRSRAVKEYKEKLETLRMEVESVKIPTWVSTFTAFFDKLSEMAKVFTDHSQEFGEMDELLIELSDLRSLVEWLKEDNDINIGWTATSGILAGISAGTAFISVIGWGVSAALNMAPVVGRLVHTSVVRNKRSKESSHSFTMCKIGDKVKIFRPLDIVVQTQASHRLSSDHIQKYLKHIGTVKRVVTSTEVLVQFDDGISFLFHHSLLFRVS
ncbi:hypothetical protein Btru_013567 [Bulinus truncatus]|nr:hypothetical protein Btru_013567 [Bulinus truncatus]